MLSKYPNMPLINIKNVSANNKNYEDLFYHILSLNLFTYIQETPLHSATTFILKIKWALCFLLCRAFHGMSVNHGCSHITVSQ